MLYYSEVPSEVFDAEQSFQVKSLQKITKWHFLTGTTL